MMAATVTEASVLFVIQMKTVMVSVMHCSKVCVDSFLSVVAIEAFGTTLNRTTDMMTAAVACGARRKSSDHKAQTSSKIKDKAGERSMHNSLTSSIEWSNDHSAKPHKEILSA
eukprot:6196563-Pleurochrysis_carterae.AAC.2